MDGIRLSTRRFIPFFSPLKGALTDLTCRFSQIDYTLRCMFPKWSDWNVTYTRKGQWKHRARQILGPVMLLAAFVGLYWIRKAGGSRVALWKALRT